MQSKGVAYILGFCTAVCLICSVFVAATAVGLKEQQEKNKELDRQKKVLVVAGLLKEGAKISAKEVQLVFKKRIKAVVVDLKKGQIDAKASEKANTFDQQKAAKDPKESIQAPKNLAGVGRVPNKALVYLVSQHDMDDQGKGFHLQKYILPIEGKGLWSTLYGFIALASDFNQVQGLTFYQHAETPGLGGEVDNLGWKAKWPNRLVFGSQNSDPSSWNKVRLSVIKGQAGSPDKDPHRVDGLSGATITSNGVTHLLHFWLGKQGFGTFIQNQIKQPKSSGLSTPTVIPTRVVVKPHIVPTPQTVRIVPAQLPVVQPAPERRTTVAVKPAIPTQTPPPPARVPDDRFIPHRPVQPRGSVTPPVQRSVPTPQPTPRVR